MIGKIKIASKGHWWKTEARGQDEVPLIMRQSRLRVFRRGKNSIEPL